MLSSAVLGESVVVQGFPWCPDKPLEIGINSFRASNLCTAHNSALSPYDSEAKAFRDALEKIRNGKHQPRGRGDMSEPLRFEIDGKRLERWVAKTIVGMGDASREEFDVLPSDEILLYVFDGRPFPYPLGLWVEMNTTKRKWFSKVFKCRLTWHQRADGKRVVCSADLSFWDVQFMFLFPIEDALPLADKYHKALRDRLTDGTGDGPYYVWHLPDLKWSDTGDSVDYWIKLNWE